MSRWLTAALLAMAFVVAAGVGFLVGEASAPSASDARDAERLARQDAFDKAEDAAFTTANRDAAVAGEKKGKAAGTEDGEAAADDELASQTPAPGTAGSTVCVAYQDYVPGVGCVPPVAPGQTAAPVNCPPGEVPVGTTGACGRP